MAQGPGGYEKCRSFRKEKRGAGEGQGLGPELVSVDQARPQAARAAAGARELAERGSWRRWVWLTCPFTEPRSDPRLVTQTPDLKGREERVREAQGQVGHGARAHPVQEAGGRESALHGFQQGLTITVNEEKN